MESNQKNRRTTKKVKRNPCILCRGTPKGHLEKMREMLLDNYHFSCSHYEYIMQMVDKDRKLR